MQQHETTNPDPVDSVFRRMGVAASPEENVQTWEPLIWLTIILGSITVIQRFAIPYDQSQFGVGFFACLLITMGMLFTGRLTVDPTRMIWYTIAILGCLVTLFFKRTEISTTSLMMFFVMYVSYAFSLKLYYHQYLSILSSFQDLILFCCWCGLAQFGIQFVLGPDFMFPFDLFMPENLFIPGFNLRIPIAESLTYEKSTGLWFLEPSIWSQFLAIAVIIELRYFNRLRRLAFYFLSIALCFSGTGPVLLLTVGSILVVSQGRIGIMMLAILGLASIFIFKDIFPFSVFYDRLADFSNPQSSGSGRFVATYWVIHDLWLEGRYSDLFWGFGPGQIEQIVSETDYFVQDSSWFKLLLEYGAFGAFFFFMFFLTSLFLRSPDKILALACLIQYLFLGGYLLSFYVHFLYLVLVVWPEIQPDEEAWFEPDDHAMVDEYEQRIEPGHGQAPETLPAEPGRRV